MCGCLHQNRALVQETCHLPVQNVDRFCTASLARKASKAGKLSFPIYAFVVLNSIFTLSKSLKGTARYSSIWYIVVAVFTIKAMYELG